MIQAKNEREAIVRLEDGDDVVGSLRGLPIDGAAIVAGIGMVRGLRLGYWNGRAYEETRVDEPAELISMQGTIAMCGEERIVHCHVAVATRDGAVRGGHLVGATVANTAELALLLVPGIRLERRQERTGLTGLFPSVEPGARA